MLLKCVAACGLYNIANTHAVRLGCRVLLTLALLAVVALGSSMVAFTSWCRIWLHSLLLNSLGAREGPSWPPSGWMITSEAGA